MDTGQFLAAGGIIGLFGATATVLFRSMRYEEGIVSRFQDQIQDLQGEMDERKAENDRCEKRIRLLVNAMQKANIEIPEEVWAP